VDVLFHHLEVAALDQSFYLGLEGLLASRVQVVDFVSHLNDALGPMRQVDILRLHLFYVDL
jgi:hypothetical protein